MPVYPHASQKALLESSPLLEVLDDNLSNAWTVLDPRGRLPKARPATGNPTGAKPESGGPLLRLVTSLVFRQVPGLEAICLLGFWENAKIVLVHSLFTVSPDVYSADVQLWGVVWDLPKYGTLALLLLTGFHFSPNFSFRGVSCTEFKTHVRGLDLKTGGPDAHAHQVAVKSCEVSLKVFSCGLWFLPSEMVGRVLELG